MYKILKNIPGDFPIIERPYKEMADKTSISEVELLSVLNKFKKEGIIRRIAAVLYHRRALYTHNAMVVWKVKDADIDRVGGIMASFPEVSHCYEREKGGYWDYNVYTMIHGKSLEDCKEIAGRISDRTGIKDFQMFFSRREFKKIPLRMIYE
ncbi:MAG: Lrp/AsnC family transcriptional regulator [Proteobacteria bacterium]|nr:Lrp/AsnC family transcriptional regulator [Pseudomonadota bacterium]